MKKPDLEHLVKRMGVTMEPGDYRKEGLVYCGKCHTPRETIVTLMGRPTLVGCTCRCRQEAREAEEREFQRRQRVLRAESLRARGIRDGTLRSVSFATARPDESLETCRRYVENWERMRENNTGLLIWGDTGSGKTYAAASIVNALIDRGVPCLMTSFPQILNGGFDKGEMARRMGSYDLVVIDDLGAERQSQYALETVYLMVDQRYKSGKPLIVTTNLTLREIRQPGDMAYRRIYDRILELCVPLAFRGASRRGEKAREKLDAARDLLRGTASERGRASCD